MALIALVFEADQFGSLISASTETWIAILHMGIIVSIVGPQSLVSTGAACRTNQTDAVHASNSGLRRNFGVYVAR